MIDLQASVDPMYRFQPTAGWMMNSSIAAYAQKLKDGNGNYLWRDSVTAGQPPTLLGNPVFLNNMMVSSLTSTAKPVAFGDWSKFKIHVVGGSGTDAGGIRFRQLNELYAKTDQVGFISFLEFDAALLKPSSDDDLCPIRVLQLA